MQIQPSTPADLETIFQLYDAAIAHQTKVSHLHWLPFERDRVVAEIEEGRQWKILIDGEVACIFLIAYSDPAIWQEKDADPAIYLHRIVTDPRFRGQNMVAKIVTWAKEFGKMQGKQHLRMDTWDENTRLKDYYLAAGFEYLGAVTPTDFSDLPSHYAGISLALFEMDIPNGLKSAHRHFY